MDKIDGASKPAANIQNSPKSSLKQRLPVDATVAQVAHSALKQIKFAGNATHRATRGNKQETGYEETSTEGTYPIRDPKESNVITKNQLQRTEKIVDELNIRQIRYNNLDRQDREYLQDAQELLNKYFEYFEVPIVKSNKPSQGNKEEKGGITKIFNLASANKQANAQNSSVRFKEAPSWKNPHDLMGQLLQLREKAETHITPEAKSIQQGLIDAMVSIRPFDKQASFTTTELYELYHDLFLYNLGSRPIIPDPEKYLDYLKSQMPQNSIGEVDEGQIKSALEPLLDIKFQQGTLTADYSSFSKELINEFVRITETEKK